MMDIEKIGQIQCFLLDMDGTVYLGDQLLPGAKEFLAYLDSRAIPFYFITNNSSRSSSDYVKKLNQINLPYGQENIFTSGEATALYLSRNMPGAKLFVVGTPSLEQEFREHGFSIVQEDPDQVVLGFDTTLTYEKIWKCCDFLRAVKPYIATHPDLNCPTDTCYMPDIGSMMAMIAASTGRYPDVIIGKPHAPIVDAIVQKTGFPLESLAMIGDRLYTDIALGSTGIMTILVLSGEASLEDLDSSPFKPDLVVKDLAEFHKIMLNIIER
jgi:4-nitrophenyl phosphatase/NagD protein